jgi:hypothetical protein
MHLFVVCTHNEGYYDALVASAKRGGYAMKTLGWNQKWGGFVWRLTLMLDALSTMNPDEVVCFTDAFDVIVLLPAVELEARYRAMVNDGRVLLSVENPIGEPVAGFVGRKLFGVCIDNKTLNAGAYMGTVTGLRVFIRLIQTTAQREGMVDDQKVLNRMCQKLRTDNMVAIDTQGDIFFHATCENGVVGFVSGSCPFGLGDGLKNPWTGRPPAILHAPAGLSLRSVCRMLSLPEGRVRSRWMWFATNYWWEMGMGMLLVVVIFGTVTLLVMRHHRLRIDVTSAP